MEKIVNYIESNKKRYLDELCELIRIPSISTQSKHKQDILKCANLLVEKFKAMGMQRTQLYDTPGHPLVYAEWLGAPGKPTLLIYGHYDVQPEDPIAEWHTPPFEPTVKGDELFGRGTADDKGQFLIHLKAVEAFLTQTKTLPINVKFLIEGEEEATSENLEAFIAANHKLLACDAVMISDTTMYEKNLPTITYSLRGIIFTQLDLQGPKQDLHSGVYGGAVINPANALAKIVAQLHDENGKVTVPGFYDDVREITPTEKKTIASLPYDDKRFMAEAGVTALGGEKGYSTIERKSTRPTLDVNGFHSGYTQEGAKTIIPSRAMAKVSMRLVPNQNPQKIVDSYTKYVKSLAPAGTTMQVKIMAANKPYFSSPEGPAMRAVTAALKRAFGKETLLIGEGGSIPVVQTFKQELGVESILMGIGTPDENIHGPNEKLYLPHFYKGILTAAYFLEELGKQGK